MFVPTFLRFAGIAILGLNLMSEPSLAGPGDNKTQSKRNGGAMALIPAHEGYIQFHGYKTWYRIVGDGESSSKLPLICLHGGPGVPHDYLKPLEAIAKTGRRVIFYDQLGCGNSDRPKDDGLFTIDLFKNELTTLLKELKIDRYHLLGQSWGGMLALEHALDHPKGLQSLILASSLASMPQWISETNRLRHELPKEIQDVLDKHEASGTIQSPEYQDATMKFYHRHVCRLEPWPKDLNLAFEKIGQAVYMKMTGPNEFTPTGTLKDWDVRDKLSDIKIPTLITSGHYDEATPLINKTLHDGIAHSKWQLFEKSAHMSHMEEPELYMKVLDEFLATTEISLKN
jgi:proline-specific peptidase